MIDTKKWGKYLDERLQAQARLGIKLVCLALTKEEVQELITMVKAYAEEDDGK